MNYLFFLATGAALGWAGFAVYFGAPLVQSVTVYEWALLAVGVAVGAFSLSLLTFSSLGS